jgi:hypothetical protein
MFCLWVVGIDYRARMSVLSSELDPPTPSHASECVSRLGFRGGRSNSPLRMREWRDAIQKTGKKVWYFVYSVVVEFGTFGRLQDPLRN